MARAHLDGDGLGGRDGGGDPTAGDGDGVVDGAAGQGGCIAIGPGLIDQGDIAARRDGDAREDQGRSGGNCGSRLGHAVYKIQCGPGLIGQGRVGPAAQIIGDGEIREGGGAGVADGDDIGHQLAGGVGPGNSSLIGGQNLQNFAHGDVGIGRAAVVDQGSLVGENSHRMNTSKVDLHDHAVHSMPPIPRMRQRLHPERVQPLILQSKFIRRPFSVTGQLLQQFGKCGSVGAEVPSALPFQHVAVPETP